MNREPEVARRYVRTIRRTGDGWFVIIHMCVSAPPLYCLRLSIFPPDPPTPTPPPTNKFIPTGCWTTASRSTPTTWASPSTCWPYSTSCCSSTTTSTTAASATGAVCVLWVKGGRRRDRPTAVDHHHLLTHNNKNTHTQRAGGPGGAGEGGGGAAHLAAAPAVRGDLCRGPGRGAVSCFV